LIRIAAAYWITRFREGFAKVEQIGKGSPLVMSIR
jgi:hypothetical protein